MYKSIAFISANISGIQQDVDAFFVANPGAVPVSISVAATTQSFQAILVYLL